MFTWTFFFRAFLSRRGFLRILIPKYLLNHGLLSQQLVKSLNEVGIHVWAWTVNDEAQMRRYLDWGVESITTDKPELMAKILQERKK